MICRRGSAPAMNSATRAAFGSAKRIRFSPTVINELRAGYTRVEIGIFNTGVGGALGFNPQISAALGIPNANTCGEVHRLDIARYRGTIPRTVARINSSLSATVVAFYFKSNNFSFADTLTWSRGSSTFKFGGDLRIRQNTVLRRRPRRRHQGPVSVWHQAPAASWPATTAALITWATRLRLQRRQLFAGLCSSAFVSRGTPGTPPFAFKSGAVVLWSGRLEGQLKT